jgi:hypothetical protein
MSTFISPGMGLRTHVPKRWFDWHADSEGWVIMRVAESIRGRSDCRALPPAGLPKVEAGHRLPDDMAGFYSECGGADLFLGRDFAVRICTPCEFVPSNPEIVGEQVPDDITSSWYIVARGGSGEYISIDLHPDRHGLCYDSFHEVHGVVGSSVVLATSFTDLVRRLLAADGGHWYWLERGRVPLGDAYDGIVE